MIVSMISPHPQDFYTPVMEDAESIQGVIKNP